MDPKAPDARLDQILARAGDGDERAWEQLVNMYSGRVFALLLHQCRDRELAEEITQATFVKVVRSICRYQEQGRFEPWLFRIAMNQLRDEMRRRKRHATTMGRGNDGADHADPAWLETRQEITNGSAADHSDPFQRASRNEQVELLKAAVEQLTEADQKIIHLRHTAGLSYAQIAEMLDEPLGTVLARGHRVIGKLRKLLADNTDVLPPHRTAGEA